jgi:hypothetical protein
MNRNYKQIVIKRHLCGMAIAYDKPEQELSRDENPGFLTQYPSRPNGSLYSRQKRQIADACEWLRINQTRDRKALIFVLTSPGFTSLANQPKFISAFVDNMKLNYGMGDYVWVREHTKRGYPHFHFVAHWHPAKWFLDLQQDRPGGEQYARINQISRYWSSLFDSDSLNSVRLGTYKGKKRTGFYLTNERHAWYLTKYLGKSIGDGSNDYLIEAGFPFQVYGKDQSVKIGSYKKAVRSFGMSENCALLSQPELFESQNLYTRHKASVQTTRGVEQVEIDRFAERVFIGESGQLSESQLTRYDWRWTGHGQTFIGIDKMRKRDRKKPGKAA